MVEPVGQAVKDQIAVLFAQGASPFDIRLATGVNRHVVFRQMRRLRRPPSSERVRSALRFSLTEREEISRGLAGGCSLRSIAAGLGRAPSSVSREVARNGGRRRDCTSRFRSASCQAMTAGSSNDSRRRSSVTARHCTPQGVRRSRRRARNRFKALSSTRWSTPKPMPSSSGRGSSFATVAGQSYVPQPFPYHLSPSRFGHAATESEGEGQRMSDERYSATTKSSMTRWRAAVGRAALAGHLDPAAYRRNRGCAAAPAVVPYRRLAVVQPPLRDESFRSRGGRRASSTPLRSGD